MPFVTPIRVEPIDARRWVLTAPLLYRGREEVWEIEEGTVTDIATIPRAVTAFVPRTGIYSGPAIVHDRLCEIAQGRWPDRPYVTRKDADGIFRRMLREERVPFLRRWTMWAAVRLGGRLSGVDWHEAWRIAVIAVFAVPFYAVPAVVTQVFLAFEWLLMRAFRLVGLE